MFCSNSTLTERPCQRYIRDQGCWCGHYLQSAVQGVLHEASISKPDIHFGKAYIDTHQVKDEQRVEFSHEVFSDNYEYQNYM